MPKAMRWRLYRRPATGLGDVTLKGRSILPLFEWSFPRTERTASLSSYCRIASFNDALPDAFC